MASRGSEYTVVGFSEEVDRRPLIFVETFPDSRLCSACGLVPNVIAILQCEHFFCKPCYEQCQRSGDVVCPLDGETCLEEEVTWKNHSSKSVMAKKVLCWNQSNGCNVVMAAADISKHFHHECGHHLARCPKCGAGILASDVWAHLESRCAASIVSRTAAVQPSEAFSQEQEPLGATCSELSDGFRGIYNAISEDTSSVQAEQKEISRTLKISVAATTSRHGETGEGSLEAGILQESLSQARIQTAKLKDQLDEFMHNVNANQQTLHNSFVEKNEALKQSLTDAVQSTIDQTELAAQFEASRAAAEEKHRETKAELDRLSLAIDGKYDRISELLGNTNASLERLVQNSQEPAEAHAESLAQNGYEIAWAECSSAEDRQYALALLSSITPVATRHTCIFQKYASLAESQQKNGWATRILEPVYLRGYCVSAGIIFNGKGDLFVLFALRKGVIDQYLEWPFNLQIKWSILHPQGIMKLQDCVTPSRLPDFKRRFSRPNVRSGLSIGKITFKTTELESGGFVQDDRLHLRLELEPTADDQP